MSFEKSTKKQELVEKKPISIKHLQLIQKQSKLAAADNRDEIKISSELTQAVADDAKRTIGARAFERRNPQSLLLPYIVSSHLHSLSDTQIRRLVNHDISFHPQYFNAQNSSEQNDEHITRMISSSNETKLAKLHEAKLLANHYKKLGFKRGDYSQLTAKQFADSFAYIKQVESSPSSRAEKQALVLVPEKGNRQFDMSREAEDIKRLGFSVVFAKTTSSHIEELSTKLQGFDLVVIGGDKQDSELLKDLSIPQQSTTDEIYTQAQALELEKKPTHESPLANLDIGFD